MPHKGGYKTKADRAELRRRIVTEGADGPIIKGEVPFGPGGVAKAVASNIPKASRALGKLVDKSFVEGAKKIPKFVRKPTEGAAGRGAANLVQKTRLAIKRSTDRARGSERVARERVSKNPLLEGPRAAMRNRGAAEKARR